jgi:hypothetical protein
MSFYLLRLNIVIYTKIIPIAIIFALLSEIKVLPLYFLFRYSFNGILLTKEIVDVYVSNKKEIDNNFEIMNMK